MSVRLRHCAQGHHPPRAPAQQPQAGQRHARGQPHDGLVEHLIAVLAHLCGSQECEAEKNVLAGARPGGGAHDGMRPWDRVGRTFARS